MSHSYKSEEQVREEAIATILKLCQKDAREWQSAELEQSLTEERDARDRDPIHVEVNTDSGTLAAHAQSGLGDVSLLFQSEEGSNIPKIPAVSSGPVLIVADPSSHTDSTDVVDVWLGGQADWSVDEFVAQNTDCVSLGGGVTVVAPLYSTVDTEFIRDVVHRTTDLSPVDTRYQVVEDGEVVTETVFESPF